MDKTHYNLPIRFETLIGENEEEHTMCTELESIDQHIELLLTTCPGELKFDQDWGCHIWDMDFQRVISHNTWEKDFKSHVLAAIQKYEKRISDIGIEIDIHEVTREDYALQTTAIKKRVTLKINAILVSNNKKCGFKYILYLGPLSID